MRNFTEKAKNYFFKLFLSSAANQKYVRMPAVFESIVSADPAKIFIFVVAFNEPQLMALHWAAIEKFCRDEHEYFVIDNSNQPEASKSIRQFSEDHRINYVRLPKNPARDGSFSHGFALNWAYHNFVAKFHPQQFGIMDSDFFPTQPFSIRSYLDKGDAWGIVTERRPFTHLWRSVWYLWVGCAFFETKKFRVAEPNFLPTWGVDTGGRIRIDVATVKKLPDVYDRDRDGAAVPEIILPPGVWPPFAYGSFVHLTGASWGAGTSNIKLEWVERMLAGKAS